MGFGPKAAPGTLASILHLRVSTIGLYAGLAEPRMSGFRIHGGIPVWLLEGAF